MNKLTEYLKQPSTWRGITAIIGLIGINLSPEKGSEIMQACLFVIGAIEVFRNENNNNSSQNKDIKN